MVKVCFKDTQSWLSDLAVSLVSFAPIRVWEALELSFGIVPYPKFKKRNFCCPQKTFFYIELETRNLYLDLSQEDKLFGMTEGSTTPSVALSRCSGVKCTHLSDEKRVLLFGL